MTDKLNVERLRALDEKVAVRFWSKVDKTPGQGPNGDCWVWTASKDRKGYGYFRNKGTGTAKAHRFSLSLKLGRKAQELLHACHTCDNPNCVNPDHLWEGSNQQNILDSIEKKRNPNKERTHCRKAGHPLSGDNLYTPPSGKERICRECVRQSRAKYLAKNFPGKSDAMIEGTRP